MPEYDLRLYRGVWCLYWREDGQSKRRSTGCQDRSEAARVKLAVEASEREVAAPLLTVRDLWQRYKLHLGTRPTTANMDSYGRSLLPFFGHVLPAEITPALCGAYVERRRGASIKDGTIRAELNLLSNALGYAVKYKFIPSKPFIPRPRPSAPRDRYLTKTEAKALVEACQSPHMRAFVILALSTGARSSALLDLTWDRVTLDHEQPHRSRADFRLADGDRPMKGRVVAPLNTDAVRALVDLGGGVPGSRVLSWHGRPIRRVATAFRIACENAGLKGVSPHILRHTAAVWMAESGVAMSQISQMLGHSSSRMTESVYARFSPDYLQGAASALSFMSVEGSNEPLSLRKRLRVGT